MARYLSRADLSRIAGKYIDQYYTRFGISKDAPEPIDPERLAGSVLGLNVKMLPLCSDGSILGLTVFQRCGFTVTLGDGTKLVEIFMPKDIVIDSALAADSCTGCRNFTIAHEAAHHILADLFPNDYGKAVKCRWAHCLSGTKRTTLMGGMAGKYPCGRVADANISGQRRDRTGSAAFAEWNPVPIRI